MIKKITKRIQPALISAGGGIAATIAEKKIGFLANMDPKLRYSLLLLAGLAISAQKGDTMRDLGSGMATVAAMRLATTFFPGIGDLAGINDETLYGVYDEIIDPDTEVSGTDETLYGFAGDSEWSDNN